MVYAVILRTSQGLQVQGQYKSQDSAQKRADKVHGGEVSIFRTFESDPEKILAEYRDEEARAL